MINKSAHLNMRVTPTFKKTVDELVVEKNYCSSVKFIEDLVLQFGKKIKKQKRG